MRRGSKALWILLPPASCQQRRDLYVHTHVRRCALVECVGSAQLGTCSCPGLTCLLVYPHFASRTRFTMPRSPDHSHLHVLCRRPWMQCQSLALPLCVTLFWTLTPSLSGRRVLLKTTTALPGCAQQTDQRVDTRTAKQLQLEGYYHQLALLVSSPAHFVASHTPLPDKTCLRKQGRGGFEPVAPGSGLGLARSSIGVSF